MTGTDWEAMSREFFDRRAAGASGASLEDLCFVSGRDPRLWSDPAMCEDLFASITGGLAAGPGSSILEVGCASGFIAAGLAPRVGAYLGVDVARQAVAVARRHGIPRTKFSVADGRRLPFKDSAFDAVLCYDVFTNFPGFGFGASIIREMFRVVRPGGRAMVGSVPDAACADRMAVRAAEVSADLERRFGALPVRPELAPRRSWLERLGFRSARPAAITCYEFRREDFESLARELGAVLLLEDVHPLNPYRGLRFNAIFLKPSR